MVVTILKFLADGDLGKKDIAKSLGKARPTRYLNDLVRKLVATGIIEYTIPARPKSRLQKYRLTEKGRLWLTVR